MMKIAIISRSLSTHSGSRAPIELAKHLVLHNQITLIVFEGEDASPLKQELEKKGVKVIFIKTPPVVFGKWFGSLKLLPYLKGQDIISFHGTFPVFLVAKLSRIPIVKTYYGTQLDAYLERFLPGQKLNLINHLLNFLGNRLILYTERVSFSLASEVIGISRYTSGEAKKLYGRKIPYIHLGVNLPSLNKSSIINHKRGLLLRNKSSVITILSVSRFTPYKGFHRLIEVFKDVSQKFPNIKLILVGSAPNLNYLNYLKKLSKNFNIQIIPNLPDEELTKLYQEADIYTTCDRYLFFGLPPLEAALFSKPSLALNYCAASEIIYNNKTGLVANNLEEFKKDLILLIRDERLRINLGKQAQKKVVKYFNLNNTVNSYEKLLSKYVKTKN